MDYPDAQVGTGAAGIFLISIIFFQYYFNQNRRNRVENVQGLKSIPRVSGKVPFFGHALAFAMKPKEFLDECKNKYGVPFEISLLGNPIVIVDGEYRSDFFFASEKFLR